MLVKMEIMVVIQVIDLFQTRFKAVNNSQTPLLNNVDDIHATTYMQSKVSNS